MIGAEGRVGDGAVGGAEIDADEIAYHAFLF